MHKFHRPNFLKFENILLIIGMEEGSFPLWKGLFDWSLKYQDGTKPTNFDPSEFTPERRQWLDHALKYYMQDFADRMTQIKDALSDQAAKLNSDEWLDKQEALLDELIDIVCSIDHARDLHKIGGLPPLLSILASPQHPSLRWRSLEVIATCAANNPPVQDWFREGGVIAAVMSKLDDADKTVRVKALLALSALIRHSSANLTLILKPPANPSSTSSLHGSAADSQTKGSLSRLIELCEDDDSRVVRKALGVVHYISATLSPTSDPDESPSLEAIERANIIRTLAQSAGTIASLLLLQPEASDAAEKEGEVGAWGVKTSTSDVRQAALLVLIEVSKLSSGGFTSVKSAPGLIECLVRLKKRHLELSVDDKEAEEEEGVLLSQLTSLLMDAPAPAA